MIKQQLMDELLVEAQKVCDLVCGSSNLVWGEGNLSAGLALVGEAPGQTEDRMRKPFVGRAGKLLDAELALAAISRSEIYITNVVKCRPVVVKNGRESNRAPNTREVLAWQDILMRELELISPRVILCLGAIAASQLIHPGFRMNLERGKVFDGPFGSLVIATFHPSYVLRALTYDGGKIIDQFRTDLTESAHLSLNP